MAGDLGQLRSVDWDKLQGYADRLEAAWKESGQGGGAPDLAKFLPPPSDPLRGVVLQELVKTELEIRWRQGLPTSLEHYLEKFPELGKASDLPAALIHEEFRVRQQYGDRPPIGAYKIRFPNQFAELEKLQSEDPRPTAPLSPGTLPLPPKNEAPKAAEAPTHGTQSTVASGGTMLPGGYKLIKRIGSGTFGEVWKAEAPGGVPCAVKIVIRPVDADEAQRELHALELIKQLQHPFLMQTHRFEIFEDRLYIVMELADGSLRDRLKQRRKEGKGGIPVPELLRYFRESAEGLDFLHSEKVLHRDIKPENILLLKGHAKVADFGLARGQGAGASMFSATGCGTPAYMAPEVWRGKVSHHTDQYSLAVAYAELRLDRRLFTGSDFMQVMMNHLEKTPDLEGLGEPEKKVLLKAMAKDPAQRYPNCTAFVDALEEALASELGRATVSTARQPTPSAQDLRAGESALGTVGRGNLPSRPGSSDRTEDWRPAGKEQRSFFRSFLLLLSVFIPIGVGVWYFLPEPRPNPPSPSPVTASIRLRPLKPIELRAGEKTAIQLNVDRAGTTDLIEISFPNPHSGLTATVDDPSLEPGEDSVILDVKASDELEPGSIKIVTVRADCGDLHDTKTLEVKVLPLETLPSDCEKAANAQVVKDAAGKKFYSRINLIRGTTKVPFVLAAGSGKPGEPTTFYIMEDKAWVALYRQFAQAEPRSVLSKKWEELAKRYGNEQCPVLGTDVEDADRFARWLGGRLPSQAQWDRAAGRGVRTPEQGPFEPPFDAKARPLQVAVNVGKALDKPRPDGKGTEPHPLPVGQASRDKSIVGCRDMSGNGLEWTRDLSGLGKQVPLPAGASRTGQRVLLRGWDFIHGEPLIFKNIDTPESVDYADPESDVGVRVVLEPSR